MTTIDATLRGAVAGAGDDLTLTLDPAFQGLPDTAHGGSVLALFDALAARAGTRTLRGHYHRRVPLGVPLALTLAREADGLACRVADGTGAVLVDGGVAGAASVAPAAGVAATDARDAASGGAPGVAAAPLPVSRGAGQQRRGLLWAAAAGVLWGSYFVPAQSAGVTAQVSNFPLAVGMLAGGLALAQPGASP